MYPNETENNHKVDSAGDDCKVSQKVDLNKALGQDACHN